MLKTLLFSTLASLVLFTSCKKSPSPEVPATPCSATLYGFNIPAASIFDTSASCAYGNIDTGTATVSTTASFSNSSYSKQGAYNSSDGSYYVFKTRLGSDAGSKLYRVTTSGGVTLLNNVPSLGADFGALTFNRVNNKLYCFYLSPDTTYKFGEITVSGSNFTVSPLGVTQHSLKTYSSTVDNNTGNIYYLVADTAWAYIEKYNVATAVFSTIDSFSAVSWEELNGLRFNTNDNMLYLTQSHFFPTSTSTSELIRINPVSGGHVTMGSFGIAVSPEFSAAAFDQCNNQYVFSTMVTGGTSGLYRLNLSGTIISYHLTSGLFMGLDLNY
jgi:hypothetical protein